MLNYLKKHLFGDSFNPPSTSSILPGTYTVATLPNPSNYQAKYAFVTDLGGGADMVLSDGSYWKHIRQGVVTNMTIANTITISPLYSPPIIQFTGNNFSSVSTINYNVANLYTSYLSHFIIPSGVLSTVTGLVGSIGLYVSGGNTINLTGGTWSDYQWNGSSLIELGKGNL